MSSVSLTRTKLSLHVCVQLLRKEGDFHAPRLLDEKEMRANEDMQLKKKNRKSGTPCKVRDQEGKGGKVSVRMSESV